MGDRQQDGQPYRKCKDKQEMNTNLKNLVDKSEKYLMRNGLIKSELCLVLDINKSRHTGKDGTRILKLIIPEEKLQLDDLEPGLYFIEGGKGKLVHFTTLIVHLLKNGQRQYLYCDPFGKCPKQWLDKFVMLNECKLQAGGYNTCPFYSLFILDAISKDPNVLNKLTNIHKILNTNTNTNCDVYVVQYFIENFIPLVKRELVLNMLVDKSEHYLTQNGLLKSELDLVLDINKNRLIGKDGKCIYKVIIPRDKPESGLKHGLYFIEQGQGKLFYVATLIVDNHGKYFYFDVCGKCLNDKKWCDTLVMPNNVKLQALPVNTCSFYSLCILDAISKNHKLLKKPKTILETFKIKPGDDIGVTKYFIDNFLPRDKRKYNEQTCTSVVNNIWNSYQHTNIGGDPRGTKRGRDASDPIESKRSRRRRSNESKRLRRHQEPMNQRGCDGTKRGLDASDPHESKRSRRHQEPMNQRGRDASDPHESKRSRRHQERELRRL